MRNPLRGFGLFGLGMLAGTGLSLTVLAIGADTLPFAKDALRKLTEAMSRVRSDYIDPVDDYKLVDGCLTGMLSELDPHSAYINAECLNELKTPSAQVAGVGLELTMDAGAPRVVAAIDDTPAARAGMQNSDIIVSIDGVSTAGKFLSDVTSSLRGKPGTSINLVVRRSGSTDAIPYNLTRTIIKIQSVKGRLMQPGIGYVRISQFTADTEKNLKKAVADLERTSGGRLEGLVLDLRNNPGGVLNAAIGVSDAFLDKGLIMYTEGRVPDAKKSKARPNVSARIPTDLENPF